MIDDDPRENIHGLRTIKTARTEQAINEAARAGFRPLVKSVKPSKEIRVVVCVWQDLVTGEIRTLCEPHVAVPPPGWKEVVKPTAYYPYHFPEPFAAYLIPPDLQPGERVWVEDLIEDLIGTTWNSNNSRLPSSEAVWDGTHLKIDYAPDRDRSFVVG